MKKQDAEPKRPSRKRSPRNKPRAKKPAEHREAQSTGRSERAARPTPQPEGGVAAVDRALSILGAYEPGDGALTLAELARRTKLYKSTILRLAQSLIHRDYLRRLDDGSYQIGPAPLMLAALYQRSLRLGDVLLPLMRELAEQTGESVSVYSRRGDVRVCIHRVDSQHAVRDHVREGDVLPLGRGSGGRILLAFGGAKGEPYETARREYCYASVGERDAETAGVSVPIFGGGQILLGSLTLAGPRSRMDETFIANARAVLLRAAARATSALGGDASPFDAALALILAGKRRGNRAAKPAR